MQHIASPLDFEDASHSFSAALKKSSRNPVRRWTWVMQEKVSDAEIGLLGLVGDNNIPEAINAEIGAVINAEFQNQGFAAEAINALVNVAFEHTSLAELHTNHAHANKAANGLMSKLGFQYFEASSSSRWQLCRANWQDSNNQWC